ncbi:MAG: FAD-dependent oxidoreductase [Kiritimatiellia bacterium]|jgi:hypothetical protein|nr:FAD-dependent oxidoreductase [Kiritimatiellia bacterium]
MIPPVKASPAADVDGKSYDLVVVGGTPGGIACAVRAAREGLTVLLVNHTGHIGGFMTSGAGGWEAPYDGLRSPLYAEMRTNAAAYYRQTYGETSDQYRVSLPSEKSRAHIDRPKVEPRIAELLFNRMVSDEKTLDVLLGHIPFSAGRDGALLKTVTLKPLHGGDGVTVSAKVFADAMYEGDLMAVAGVSNRIGREARSEYNEPHAGVIYSAGQEKAKGQRGFPLVADKGQLNIRYNKANVAQVREGPQSGEADGSVMAYNYRLILTRNPSNRVMVAKPSNYDPDIARSTPPGGSVPNLPNSKIAWNGGRLVGPQNGYPDGDWPTRERISKQCLDAMLMVLWYVQNDPSAPEKDRKQFADYGLAADEFPDNNNLPYEVYVREARRLVGRKVFTEKDNLVAPGTRRTPIHEDSVAMTDWPMDSVACTDMVREGRKRTEGNFFLAEDSRPAQVPYRCLLAKEVDNLLVPVALSASHVGWGSIRLEPVWMQTGEAAGFAAALAVKHGTTPAALNADLLVRTLANNHFVVSFFNDVDATAADPAEPAIQYFGTRGFFSGYDAKPDEPLTEPVAKVWARNFTRLNEGAQDGQACTYAVAKAEAVRSAPAMETDRFLFWLHATEKGHDSHRLTRGEACRLMYTLLKEAPAVTPEGAKKRESSSLQKVQPVRSTLASDVSGKTYDLVVVGGTPGGIACAARAAREGLSVLLVQHNRHIGGMLANALMQWDALYAGYRAPIFNEIAQTFDTYYREAYGTNSAQYSRAQFTQNHYPMANFEPSVAEHFLNRLVSAETNITTLLCHYPVAADREGALIRSLTLREYGTTNDIVVRGMMFADATYEGDLAARVGVPYRVGREGRDETGEPHAGVVFTNLDPGKGPKDAVEGRLNIHPYNHRQGSIDTNSPFTADHAIQAYNYRFCLSSNPGNCRLPQQPPGYDRNEYLHYNRKGMSAGAINKKGSFNNPILPGENYAYPEADWPTRETIIERHKNFALGLMYFLQNDPSVPEAKRNNYLDTGLPIDEFPDNGNIPYEPYVREARRIVGRFVFREQDNCLAPDYARTPVFSDSVAITDWPMDSHACSTNTRPGFRYDGKIILTEESRPAQIPYRALLPQGVDNLLVPVCLSATHVAWGAVRLEPVFMQLGEAAGFAAALSKRLRATPAQLNPDRLVRELCRNRMMVTFFNQMNVASDDPRIAAAQYFGTKGFFADYDARLEEPLTEAVALLWREAFEHLRQGLLDPAKLAAAVHAVDKPDQPRSVETRGEYLSKLWSQLEHP